MRCWRSVGWIGANVCLWLVATMAYGAWIDHEVGEDYRLGYRVSTDGDSTAIPIFGFAIDLFIVLLAANAVVILVRTVRARGPRPVT